MPAPDMMIPTENAFRLVKYCVVTVMEGWYNSAEAIPSITPSTRTN